MDKELLHFTIGQDQDGLRLDQALANLSGFSRTRTQQLMKDGCVIGAESKASIRVKIGDHFQIALPPTTELSLEPENIPLDILYEDDHLLVVNKAAGIVVHPSFGHGSGTLVHALLYHCPNLPGINGIERPGIVHRLDQGTSGSLVVAKSEVAHRKLTEMFSQHDIDRQYLAWCRSAPNWLEQRIETMLGRHPKQRKKMAVVGRGKEAITDAKLEKQFVTGDFCRLRLTLHTGRTHQIRVHLAHLNLPIIGDPLYGRSFRPKKTVAEPLRDAMLAMQYQALHAEVLGFQHPISGESILCKAPLPEALTSLNNAFEKYG
ncbi:MAG: RluA family pseudouridine synthase [Mariprofundaceae bacterium]